MKGWVLCLLLCFPAIAYSAETESPQVEEQTLYEHYLALQHMQESLAGRSLEAQAKLQPQIQRAERKACERLRKERQERVPKEEYRQQGGDQFLVFAQQFEQYCATFR